MHRAPNRTRATPARSLLLNYVNAGLFIRLILSYTTPARSYLDMFNYFWFTTVRDILPYVVCAPLLFRPS